MRTILDCMVCYFTDSLFFLSSALTDSMAQVSETKGVQYNLLTVGDLALCESSHPALKEICQFHLL